MALQDTAPVLAIRLLAKYGADVTITQQKAGVYDPATSSNPITTKVMVVKGLPEEYAESLRFLGDKLQSTGVIEGDKKITIQGKSLAFIPSAGDKATVLNITYQIMGVAAVYINNIIAVYVLHIRKI